MNTHWKIVTAACLILAGCGGGDPSADLTPTAQLPPPSSGGLIDPASPLNNSPGAVFPPDPAVTPSPQPVPTPFPAPGLTPNPSPLPLTGPTPIPGAISDPSLSPARVLPE